MPTQTELYAVVERRLREVLAGAAVRVTTVRRLALLIVGLPEARSSVLSRTATGVWESGVGTAERPGILRRLPAPQPVRDGTCSLGLRVARRWLARAPQPDPPGSSPPSLRPPGPPPGARLNHDVSSSLNLSPSEPARGTARGRGSRLR